MAHEDLVKKAREALAEVFSDKSVSLAETKKSLEELAEEIEVFLDAILQQL